MLSRLFYSAAFALFFNKHFNMFQRLCKSVLRSRFKVHFAVFKIFVYLSEYKRISLAASAYHNRVTTRHINHSFRILGTFYIAVADYRNWNRFFYFLYYIPIRRSTVKLCPRSAVYRNRRRSALFYNLCNFNCIYTVIVPTFTNFYRHRHRRRGRNFMHYLAYFFGCLKQCAAVTVIYDFWCGTAHIYIYYIRFYRHNFRYHFRHYISVRAEYLYRTRTFFVIYPH